MSTAFPAVKIKYVAALCLVIVAAIDMVIPGEYVVDIVYLCCTLLVFREKPQTIIGFSIAACLLILINALFQNSLKLSLAAWTNSLISILAIITIAYITIQFRKLDELSRMKELEYLKAMEEMLFITSHKVRKPVANIFALAEIINVEDDLSETELKVICQHFISSANDLDDVTNELNSFIKEAGQKQSAF
jgi:signal transduction histidine kinase